MFRVTGLDAQGRWREVSICAATETEARALAMEAGVVTVESVSTPPPLPPSLASRFPRFPGWVVGIFACLGCLGSTILGAVLGGLLGNAMEPPNNLVRFHWFFGSIIGAAVGLVCGVSVLVACLKYFWDRR